MERDEKVDISKERDIIEQQRCREESGSTATKDSQRSEQSSKTVEVTQTTRQRFPRTSSFCRNHDFLSRNAVSFQKMPMRTQIVTCPKEEVPPDVTEARTSTKKITEIVTKRSVERTEAVERCPAEPQELIKPPAEPCKPAEPQRVELVDDGCRTSREPLPVQDDGCRTASEPTPIP
ncbi:hypothetical protein OSTOST_23843, partial [Ostertagia ostertagi]